MNLDEFGYLVNCQRIEEYDLEMPGNIDVFVSELVHTDNNNERILCSRVRNPEYSHVVEMLIENCSGASVALRQLWRIDCFIGVGDTAGMYSRRCGDDLSSCMSVPNIPFQKEAANLGTTKAAQSLSVSRVFR